MIHIRVADIALVQKAPGQYIIADITQQLHRKFIFYRNRPAVKVAAATHNARDAFTIGYAEERGITFYGHFLLRVLDIFPAWLIIQVDGCDGCFMCFKCR
ncbi:hypothetical protein D3C80_1764440 [compost metagenome]